MQRRCTACNLCTAYDGAADGILNLNDLDLFTHRLLQW